MVLTLSFFNILVTVIFGALNSYVIFILKIKFDAFFIPSIILLQVKNNYIKLTNISKSFGSVPDTFGLTNFCIIVFHLWSISFFTIVLESNKWVIGFLIRHLGFYD